CSVLYETDVHQYLEPIDLALATDHDRECDNHDDVTIATSEQQQQQQQQQQTPAIRPEQLEFGQCALDWYKDSHKNYHNNKLVALIAGG
ncbi:MAG: hypothetical protein N6V41_00670, partial [Candidatus Portiera aleyrodidarum]|nr:hypothetical protein [Candidatus Portiera aleyrodidarum]